MSQNYWPNIPGYQITDVAGTGGMGLVYKAEQSATGRVVAIKMLTDTALSEKSLRQFRREVEIIASLEHPHILPVYDFGEHDGTPFLVMRFLEEGSVAQQLAAGNVGQEKAIRWIEQIGSALDYAHQQEIVHKDVKLSNMLLDEHHNVYLVDFGIASTIAVADQTRRGAGSVAYMSPEQAQGEGVEGRTDVYALSVSLFELLVGEKPYTGQSAVTLIMRHINDPIPSIRDRDPNIAPALDTLIQWGMAKRPQERPLMSEFVRLLRVADENPGAIIRPTGWQPNLPPADTESGKVGSLLQRWPIIAGLFLVVAVAAYLLLSGAFPVTPVDDPTATPTRVVRATNTPVLLPTSTPRGQLFVDSFSNPNRGLRVRNEDVTYEEGALVFRTVDRNFLLFIPTGEINRENVAVDVTMQYRSGPDNYFMGVICRFQDAQNYTLLAFNHAGNVIVWQFNEGARSVLMQEELPAIVPQTADMPMAVLARCEGEALELRINEDTSISTIDPMVQAGDVALAIIMLEEGELSVEFDDLLIQEP